MCAFSRSICSKAAALARAARSWPPNTSPRSSRWPGSSLRATTAPTSSRSRSLLSTPTRTKPNSPSCPRAAQPVDLAYGTEIVAKDQTGQTTADIDAPIVFVGYGIHAPEYNWDDYAGVDLKGKVALVIVNEPPSDDEKFFKGKALTYYGRWTYKYEEAARRGAVGVLIIHRSDLASYGWEVVRNSQAIEKSYLQGDPDATLRAAAWIQHDVAQHLFTLAGLGDLDQAIDRAGKRGFHAAEIPVRLRAHVESRVRRYVSSNVVARAPGASSGGNSVLYTAHYDHLGIDPDAKGDNIYNGAADNGTGCGILLEMARAFAQSSRRAAARYLLRRRHRGRAGPARLAISSACIRPFPHVRSRSISTTTCCCPSAFRARLTLNGAERIDFWPTVQTVAKAFDLAAAARSNPHGRPLLPQRSFLARARRRSRVFSRSGRAVRGPRRSLGPCAISEDYVAHHYHQPSDEYQRRLGFPRQREAGAIRLCSWLAGQRTAQAGRVAARR